MVVKGSYSLYILSVVLMFHIGKEVIRPISFAPLPPLSDWSSWSRLSAAAALEGVGVGERRRPLFITEHEGEPPTPDQRPR